MAIDPNKKFLYFNKDGTSGEMDDALCFPISSFIGAETQTASGIDFHFKGSKGTDATIIRGIIDTGFINIKTFYKKFVDQINFGEIAFIKVTDYAERQTHQSDVTFAMTGDVVPTFTLQDTDFVVADSISIGGHSVNDIDITNEFVDSDEHLMTSKAINARIAAAGGGVSVSDSTSNTDFPVVFHDESNNLHDDTGAFEYNPSSGNLTVTTVNGGTPVTAGAVNVSSGSQAPIGMQIARRTITKSEANSMHSTPIEIVPAQGANTIIVPHEVILRVDRSLTQAVSGLNFHVHYADLEPGVYSDSTIFYIRRFMYNETGDRVIQAFQGSFSGHHNAQNLTDDINHAVEMSFSTAATTNCFTSIDVFMLYHVIDIS